MRPSVMPRAVPARANALDNILGTSSEVKRLDIIMMILAFGRGKMGRVLTRVCLTAPTPTNLCMI